MRKIIIGRRAAKEIESLPNDVIQHVTEKMGTVLFFHNDGISGDSVQGSGYRNCSGKTEEEMGNKGGEKRWAR